MRIIFAIEYKSETPHSVKNTSFQKIAQDFPLLTLTIIYCNDILNRLRSISVKRVF